MREKILAMMMAAMAATGCSKGDAPDSHGSSSLDGYEPSTAAIEFTPNDDNWGDEETQSSRGDLLGSEFEDGDSFGVFAYYRSKGTEWDETTATPNFMHNQLVEYDDETGWSYTPLKYWSNCTDDKFRFYAYAPHTKSITPSLSTENGAPSLTYLPYDVNDDETSRVKAPQMVDLLTAKRLVEVNSHAENVTFEFEHQLAQLRFSVRHNGAAATSDGKSGDIVMVRGVTILDIYPHTGSFSGTDGAFVWNETVDRSGEPVDCLTELLDGSSDGGLLDMTIVNPAGTSSMVVTDREFTPVTADCGAIMMSPQTFANYDSNSDGVPDQVKLGVDFRITNSYDTSTSEPGVAISVATEVVFDALTIEKGYIYNLCFTLGVTGYDSVVLDTEIKREKWYTAIDHDFGEQK